MFILYIFNTAIRVQKTINIYLILIGCLLLGKVIINTHFNQMIKTITIENPYTVIDTISDLLSKAHITTKLYMPNTTLQDILVFSNMIDILYNTNIFDYII